MHLHKEVPKQSILDIVKKFSGEITQLPPIRSAVKRVQRKRKVYYFEILEIKDKDILFRVGCEAGTYIRKLIHDLGKELNCGAHMVQLIRTKAGPFNEKKMYTLHDLKDAYEFYKEGNEKEIKKIIQPFEKAVEHLGKIWVLDGAVDPLCHGSELYAVGISKLTENIEKNDTVAIFTLKNELICIGKATMNTKEMINAKKGTVVTKTKVFMERGKYQKDLKEQV